MPKDIAAVPRIEVGDLPTPVEALPEELIRELAPDFGGSAWIKRDDLSGRPYGGNKVRKLEYLLAEAAYAGADRLITVGATGSHHALATTVYGRRLGFEVTLVLFPQSVTPHVRKVLLTDQALGAELRFTRRELVRLELLRARWAHRRERPVVIPAGGSTPVGALGFVNAGLELSRQVERGDMPCPDVVYVAAGTLGTLAGLAVGFALAELPSRLVGFRIVDTSVGNRATLEALIRGTMSLLGVAHHAGRALAAVELRGEQFGAGYGRPTDAGDAAAEQFGRYDLPLDPTYTAKAAAGFIAELRDASDGVHLFWHTLSGAEPAGIEPADPQDLPPRFRAYLGAEQPIRRCGATDRGGRGAGR